MVQLSPLTSTSLGVVTLLGIFKIISFIRQNATSKKRRLRFHGKVALVTGASSGLGERLAEDLFTELRMRVILLSRREDKLQEVKRRLLLKEPSRENDIAVVCMDLSDTASIKADSIIRAFGEPPFLLLNNAGISYRGNAKDTLPSVYEHVMNLNYIGQVALTQCLLQPMLSHWTDPSIIFISSIQGLIAIPFRSAYAASKFALQAFAESLRAELSASDPQAVVSVISPSYIQTNISRNAITETGDSHDIMDPATAKGMLPEKVSQQVLARALIGGETAVTIGPLHHRLAVYLRVLLPRIYRLIMASRAKKNAP